MQSQIFAPAMASSCAIISIEGLQRRRFRHVDWTKIMTNVPKGKTALAFLLGPNNSRNLVMTRNHGAIIAVILDDTQIDENSLLRFSSVHVEEFLEPYCDDIVAPELSEQYDALQLHVSTQGDSLLGPLTSGRAALIMKNMKFEADQAIILAIQEGRDLVTRQSERVKHIQTFSDLAATNAR